MLPLVTIEVNSSDMLIWTLLVLYLLLFVAAYLNVCFISSPALFNSDLKIFFLFLSVTYAAFNFLICFCLWLIYYTPTAALNCTDACMAVNQKAMISFPLTTFQALTLMFCMDTMGSWVLCIKYCFCVFRTVDFYCSFNCLCSNSLWVKLVSSTLVWMFEVMLFDLCILIHNVYIGKGNIWIKV